MGKLPFFCTDCTRVPDQQTVYEDDIYDKELMILELHGPIFMFKYNVYQ